MASLSGRFTSVWGCWAGLPLSLVGSQLLGAQEVILVMKQMAGRLFLSTAGSSFLVSHSLSGGPLALDMQKRASSVILPERFDVCFLEEGHGQ